MFGLGWAEIIIILIILLLVFGVSRIPQIGTNLGKGIKNFQKSVRDGDDDKDSKEENGDKRD
jgi:sec-independent protein translocase protein TatA